MPMVRPMSGFATVLQTWPLGDSIGVRQQYPTVSATVEGERGQPPHIGQKSCLTCRGINVARDCIVNEVCDQLWTAQPTRPTLPCRSGAAPGIAA